MRTLGLVASVITVLLGTRPASADAPRARTFLEVGGGWGLQLGKTDYLPDGTTADWQHPFVNGWSFGGAAGWEFVPGLALFAGYEHRAASSWDGSITGAVERLEGSVAYDAVVLGLRLYRDLGPGRLRAEVAAGVVAPFDTRLEVDYDPALAAANVSGSGARVDSYGLGIGLQGALGFEVPAKGPLYLALSLGVRSFVSDNDGEQTVFDNYVTDLAASPPSAITATVEVGDGAARPTTYSLQDVTARVSLGVRF